MKTAVCPFCDAKCEMEDGVIPEGETVTCPACGREFAPPAQSKAPDATDNGITIGPRKNGYSDYGRNTTGNGYVHKCPACGGTVSPAAAICVHCGHPLKKKKKCRSVAGGFISLAIAIIGIILLSVSEALRPISILIIIASIVSVCICFTAPSSTDL